MQPKSHGPQSVDCSYATYKNEEPPARSARPKMAGGRFRLDMNNPPTASVVFSNCITT